MTVQVQRTDSDPDAEAVSTLKFWQWVDVLNTYALVTEVGSESLGASRNKSQNLFSGR